LIELLYSLLYIIIVCGNKSDDIQALAEKLFFTQKCFKYSAKRVASIKLAAKAINETSINFLIVVI
jgi:hypothetical protein